MLGTIQDYITARDKAVVDEIKKKEEASKNKEGMGSSLDDDKNEEGDDF